MKLRHGLFLFSYGVIGASCSEHAADEHLPLATAVAAVTQTPIKDTIQLGYLNTVGSRQNPLTATNKLEIGDRVQVLTDKATVASATNLGPASTLVGSLAKTSSLLSGAPVVLNGSRVTGDVVSNGSIQLINGATVTGVVKPNANTTLPIMKKFTVTVPRVGGSAVTVNSNQTTPLAAGNWGKVVVNSGGKLQLSAGIYYLDELNLESNANLEQIGAPGELWLFVRNQLTMRGTVSLNAGSKRSFVLAYLGTNAVVYETSFDGAMLLAPKASLTLSSNLTYRGAFQAKDLIVRPDAVVRFASPGNELVGLGAPAITFSDPPLARSVVYLKSTTSVVRVAGTVLTGRKLVQTQLKVDGSPVTGTWRGNSFELTVTPTGQAEAGSEYETHMVEVRATDTLGQSGSQLLAVKIALPQVPGQVFVRFNPEATQQQIVQSLASVSASVMRVDPISHHYTLNVGTNTNVGAVITALRSRSEVAYASPVSVYIPTGWCGTTGTTDPNLLRGPAWHLDNDSAYGQVGRRPWCEVGGNDCPESAPECVQNFCYTQVSGVAYLDATCDSSADCQGIPNATGSVVCSSYVAYEGGSCRSLEGTPTFDFCTKDADCSGGNAPCVMAPKKGYCLSRGNDAYDIGWDAARTSVCALQGDPSKTVIVGIAESADMCPTGSVWDGKERCGLVDVNSPDLRRNMWTNLLECCGSSTSCPTDANGQPQCQEGQLTADGAPGRSGIDDDGDGYTDFGDPEVLALITRLCTNRLDDDSSGSSDTCPTDGSFDPTGSRACCNGEDLLANSDDDEDGYIDDMHGVDFRSAAAYGELYGSTFSGRVGNYWSQHATNVASVVGSTLDNGYAAAGVHPNARIMTLSITDTTFVEAMRYASKQGARVVNMSFNTNPANCIPDPNSTDPTKKCTGAKLAEYHSYIKANEAKFRDASDRNVVYVMAAGNDAEDMTLRPQPDAAGECPNGIATTVNGTPTRYCLWQFPANVGTYTDPIGNGPDNAVVVTATNNAGRFAAQWQDYQTGANFGSNTASGSNAVDFAAPGDRIRTALTLSGDDQGETGTSFSAPMVAGVAAMLISVNPDRFDHQPSSVIARMRQTLAPCQASAGSSRGCSGSMQSPGFVDLNRALDFTGYPLPSAPLWTNRSYQLNDYLPQRSHDLDFIDQEGDGKIDFLLEVFGGPFPDQAQPRLHRYDPLTGQFFDETEARIPNLVGNYNKSVVGDVNGDGCADFVLAGFLQAAPSPDNLKGLRNRLVLQNGSAGHCLGTFRDATDEIVSGNPRLPTREDITRDVDLLDVNGDHALDILFTNAALSYAGGNFGDQLLLNDGTGAFTDVTATRLPATLTSNGHNSAVNCDVNGDGAEDIVQAVEGNINRLLINNGSGVYVDEAATRGLPTGTGFSHDVKCYDFTGDNRPEIIFARRSGLPNLYLVNDGSGHFTAVNAFPKPNTTQVVQLCDLDGDMIPEVLFGNGDIVSFLSEPNEVWKYNSITGGFDDVASSLGFNFAQTADLTEVVECADMDGQGGVDAVIIGNIGLRNWWYRKGS